MIDQKYYMYNEYRSLDMKICIEKAESLAKNNKEILIYGEEGTEKDLLARIIHNHGENKGSPFVSVNCSFMPDSLFNLELFGKNKEEPGLLQLTEDGTIHLEEISDLSLFSQAKLVETLKNRSFRRIGECYDNKVNCRIITSSKKDLLQLVNENKFNFELFYLISVFPINIPPLRKRKEDILTLANSYIDEYNKSHIYNKKFLHPHTLKLLQSYDWPGNTIELHNVISRAIHYSSSNAIKPKDITFVNIKSIENAQCSGSLKELIQAYEKNIVEQALKKYKSARRTADMLEVSHTTILKKIQKYGLEAYIS